jgi:hypothetical protein
VVYLSFRRIGTISDHRRIQCPLTYTRHCRNFCNLSANSITGMQKRIIYVLQCALANFIFASCFALSPSQEQTETHSLFYVHSYVCRKYKQCFFGHRITLRLSFESFRGRTVIGISAVCTACVDNDVSDSVIDHHCIPSPSYFIVGRRSAKFCGGSQKTATYSTKYIVCPLDSLHCRNKKAR